MQLAENVTRISLIRMDVLYKLYKYSLFTMRKLPKNIPKNTIMSISNYVRNPVYVVKCKQVLYDVTGFIRSLDVHQKINFDSDILQQQYNVNVNYDTVSR